MKIQTMCKTIGEEGCYAFIVLWCVDLPEMRFVTDYNKLVEKGIIRQDCYVKDAIKYLDHFGVTAKVKTSWEIPKDKKYAARWTYYNESAKKWYHHYVGMINGKIIENTLDYSNCVSKGKIDDTDPNNPPYRIFEVA